MRPSLARSTMLEPPPSPTSGELCLSAPGLLRARHGRFEIDPQPRVRGAPPAAVPSQAWSRSSSIRRPWKPRRREPAALRAPPSPARLVASARASPLLCTGVARRDVSFCSKRAHLELPHVRRSEHSCMSPAAPPPRALAGGRNR
ncbi:uncharacterized protein LOC123447259 [Hordeum vulgare subsp. vulgare]|uniref:uncharacterized protein LOC123447258 n=1 Tax=Hordeum vulgare subsp. vulgare TaxID=112509 RepID=UPI001D1A3717|nr:uncharacterized protein LOC123447258 [Hordeum vulgare subsp. vulgare]XP_044979783.1 uncharacterized protein LOC123447259 [Hordeum vulgare subsp. vulgare]